MSQLYPFFSICIPNYNYARYIGITIQTVLDQSWPHFEIIVADNNSSDDSVAVVEAFADPRIRIIRNPVNLGFAPNLDRATETATGDYLILLSSDDTMKPGALETYAKLIQEHETQERHLVISADIDIIDEHGAITGRKEAFAQSLKNVLQNIGLQAIDTNATLEIYHGRDLLKTVLQGSMTNVGKFVSTCYSRQLYDKVGGYRSVMSIIPDAQFSQKMMLQNPKVIFVKQPLFQYRIHGQNFYSQLYSHIKLYCDKYLLSQTYSDQELSALGMTKKDVQRNFTRYWCIDNVVSHLIRGKTLLGFRAWCFGLSAYPGIMVRQPKSWAVPVLLLLSPFAGAVYYCFKSLRR